MIRTALTEEFGIEVPVFAFTPSKAVAAAVSRAGGLGVLGCVRYNDADELDRALDYMDSETDGRPYGVDVVMPNKVPTEGSGADLGAMIPEEHRAFVSRVLDDLGVPPLAGDASDAGVLGWLGQAVVILTLAVFFMADHGRPGRMLLGLLPRHWQPLAVRLSDDVSESFGNYLRGQLLTGAAITLIAGGGLLLLRVPNALALGLLTGIFGLIPMFGMVLATIPVLLQAIPQGTSTVLWVCALYFAINEVAFNFVQPMIMGRTSNLTPAGILVAVLVGGSVGGLGGAFLAIPAAMLLQRWVNRYWLHSPAHEGLPPQAPLSVSRPEAPFAESASVVTSDQN